MDPKQEPKQEVKEFYAKNGDELLAPQINRYLAENPTYTIHHIYYRGAFEATVVFDRK